MKSLLAFALGCILLTHRLSAQEENAGTVFDDFLKEYTSTIFPAEREMLLDRFWQSATRQGIPFIDRNKHQVAFLYRGDDSVRVIGDFTSWIFKMPMRRLPESNLWYLKLVFEPDARLDYKFIVNRDKEILDPMNPKSVSGPQGTRSELAMPDFSPSAELERQPAVVRGTLASLTVESKTLGYDHQVFVYLPAGYDNLATAPVAYFQDGKQYLDYAQAPTVLDNLIAAGAIQPIIGVFVVPPDGDKRNRTTEYSFNRLYDKFVVSELIPLIDKKYKTRATADARVLIGSSLGGTSALSAAINNGDMIGNAASQSGMIFLKRDTLIATFSTTPARPRLYIGVGSYERNVGGADNLSAHRKLNKILEQRQFLYRYREFRDGHSWGRWRAELPNILRWFFPKDGRDE